MIRAMQEQLLFLYKFMRAPRQIGSITPSSVFLAKKMLEPVQWNQVRSVAELGAGTGAITRQLAQVLHKEAKVLLFEKDQHLRSELSVRFRDFACYTDACSISLFSEKTSEITGDFPCKLAFYEKTSEAPKLDWSHQYAIRYNIGEGE
jgi:phospholipid N-methyltransferase